MTRKWVICEIIAMFLVIIMAIVIIHGVPAYVHNTMAKEALKQHYEEFKGLEPTAVPGGVGFGVSDGSTTWGLGISSTMYMQERDAYITAGGTGAQHIDITTVIDEPIDTVPLK